MRIVLVCLSSLILVSMSSCKLWNNDASNTQGVGKVLEDLASTPMAKSLKLMELVKGVLVRESARALTDVTTEGLQNKLRTTLLQQIIDNKGFPRAQLDAHLRNLISPRSGMCAGANCAKTFGLTEQQIDQFLDDSLAKVKASEVLAAPENKAQLNLLLGSLKKGRGALGAGRGIGHQDYYFWDNWVATHNNKYYRFALQTPKTFPDNFHPDFIDDFDLPADYQYAGKPTPNDFDRGKISEIGYFTSENGRDWQYRGVAIPKSANPENFDSHAIWSGGATEINGRLVVPYTGLSRTINPLTQDTKLQRIGIAVLDEGTGTFQKLSDAPVLDPLARGAQGEIIAEKLGYDISNDPAVVSAWRDPYIYVDKEKGELHMYFSAKADKTTLAARLPGFTGNATIGHAVTKMDSLSAWTLLPPLDLPATYSQFELPVLVKRNNEYIMFSSVVELGQDTRKESIRAYRSSTLNGPWQPIKPGNDMIVDHKDAYYSLTVTPSLDGKNFYGTGFYKGSLTMTPMAGLEWDAAGVPQMPADVF